MKVYLIRHAKTRDAENLLTQRHLTSIVVDPETLNKAKQIKDKIGEVDIVYSSPLKRAKETTDLIFGKGNYKILNFIEEYRTPKEIIGKPRKYATEFWEIKYKKDKMNINWEPDGGESFASVAERARKLYKFLLKEKADKNYQKVVIVGHGTFFRHFLLCMAGVPWTKYPQLIFDVLRKLKWDNLQVIEVDL
jgi:broad specificity phosphatase PhoE